VQEISSSHGTLTAIGQGILNEPLSNDEAKNFVKKKRRYIRSLQKQGQVFPTTVDGAAINPKFSMEKSGPIAKEWEVVQSSAINVKLEKKVKYAAMAANGGSKKKSSNYPSSSSSSAITGTPSSGSKKRNAATSGQSSSKKRRAGKLV
jgi:hypothetical protein